MRYGQLTIAPWCACDCALCQKAHQLGCELRPGGGSGPGERRCENGPATWCTAGAQRAAVRLHDRPGHRKPESHAALLRREERLEDALRVLPRQPVSVVTDDELD